MTLTEEHKSLAREVAGYIKAGDSRGYLAAMHRQAEERGRMAPAELEDFRAEVHRLVEARDATA